MENVFIDGHWYCPEFRYNAADKCFDVYFRGHWNDRQREEFLRLFPKFEVANNKHNFRVFLED